MKISRFNKIGTIGFFILTCLLLSTFLVKPATAADTFYYHAQVKSSINPVTSSYIKRSITTAEEEGAEGLILQLDTPGGLMQSMEKITDYILNSNVPVIVWIGPAGSRAASAGVFITYASHLALMAEGTHLGAAHPVSGGGKSMDNTMEKKVTNDAVANLKSMARKRGRNESLADSFVRESVSFIAEKAVEKNVVDFMANSVVAVLEKIENRQVKLAGKDPVTLSKGTVRKLTMNSKEEFLNVLVNPNLVYILMMIGIYGLIYEFAEPGIGLGATLGGICLLLALYGMSVLPLNYAGLALIGLGVALMVLDIFVPTFGILTLGGTASFALGSVFLFKTPAFSVSLGIIIGVTIATVIIVTTAGFLVLGSFYLPAAIGDDAMIGETGKVKETLDPEGMVYVHGEYWQARSRENTSLEKGEKIEVVEKRDRELIVDRINQS